MKAPDSSRARLAMVLAGAAAVGGHLAWLLLLDPDPWNIWLGGPERLATLSGRLAVALLALEVVLVVVVWRLLAVRPSLPIHASWRLIAVLLAVQAVSAAAIPNPPVLLAVHVPLLLVVMGFGAVAVLQAAESAGRLGLEGMVERLLESGRVRWWAASLSAMTAIVLHWVVFSGIPHIPDEVVYLLQAKYLAAGRLYIDDIPPEALDAIHTMSVDGRWFGIFPVGWPLLLAVGVLLGAPWLVNPALTFVGVLVCHSLVRRMYGHATANAAAILLASSPWFLFLGASYMAHTTALVACGVAALGAWRLVENPKDWRWGLIGGSGLGFLALTRQFDAVLLGLATGGLVLLGTRRALLSLGAWAYALAAAGVGGLLTLAYDSIVTGGAFTNPITLYFDETYYPGSNRLGFGDDIGNVGWATDVLPGHSLVEAAIHMSWNASLVQIQLFGWVFGSAAVVLGALFARRWWRDTRDSFWVAVAALVVLGYALYWYQGADFGPRYWSLAILPLVALTARTLVAPPGRSRWFGAALLASLLGAPMVIATLGSLTYRDFRGMTTEFQTVADEADLEGELVLIQGDAFFDYSPGLLLNPPDFETSGPLYFRYVEGPALERLRERFPGRLVRIARGPSLTGGVPEIDPEPFEPAR